MKLAVSESILRNSVPDVKSLAVVTAFVVAIALLAIACSAVSGRHKAAVRELIWTSALTASLAMTVSLLFAPQVLVQAPAVVERARLVASSLTANVSAATVVSISAETAQRSFPVGTTIAVAWLIGVCFLGLRLVLHLRAAARLRRRAVPANDERLMAAVRDSKARAGFEGEVAVLFSSDIEVPIATGVLRPAIIFPASSSQWDETEIGIVLLHEIAHIMRRDLSSRLIALAACALNWYNPAVWWLARRASSDAELAADEAVLEMGIAGSEVAQTLLNVRDRLVLIPNLEQVMLFAHPSLLPARVRALLEIHTRRVIVPSSVRATTVVGAFMIAGALGCFRFAQIPQPVASSTVTGNPTDWTDAAAKGLIDLLRDPSPQVRAASVKSLGQLAMPQTRKVIEAMLNDPEKEVEYEAREALKNFSSK